VVRSVMYGVTLALLRFLPRTRVPGRTQGTWGQQEGGDDEWCRV
jgi:hypothetical protein